MPNIFGKEVTDYQHLIKLQAAKLIDAYNAGNKARGRDHMFNALPSAHNPKPMPMNLRDADAQAVSFITNNLQAIQAEIEEILYLDFRLDEFFPIITNVPEGARTYSYRVVDRLARGSFIDNTGKDAGVASVSVQNVPYALQYAGLIPEWTREDLRNAVFSGISLDSETIAAGTEGCMDHIEIVGLTGDARFGFQGLTNHDQITKATAAKTFALSTADEIVTSLQSYISMVIVNTVEIASRIIKTGLTLYLPIAQYDRLTTLPYGDNRDKTAWEFLKRSNPWSNRTGQELKIASVAEMDGAGDGDTDRMLLGFNNARVMEFAMPIAPRIIDTIPQAFSITAPMEYKISGLNVKRPGFNLYVDGI